MLKRVALLCAAGVLLGGCAGSEPKPAYRGWTSVDELEPVNDVVLVGQPDPTGLLRYKQAGGEMVVDLRRDREHEMGVGFDEAKFMEAAGLRYERIPLSGKSFTADDVDRFGELLDEHRAMRTGQPLVVHCGSGGRAQLVYAAYVGQRDGLSPIDTVDYAIGLGSDWEPGLEHLWVLSGGDPEEVPEFEIPEDEEEN
ncbi:MAG: sulfur transferase domain-containing protein [Planctomycetota bacterium]